MKYLEDVAYVVLVAMLIPFFIAFGWVALSVILIRQTYWALRGNSTPLTRHDGRPRRPWLERWPWVLNRVPTVQPHAAAVPVRGGH